VRVRASGGTADRRDGMAGLALHGALRLFEQAGFSYVRPKGKSNWVMRKVVS
jgi:hypothetical protein